MAAPGAPDPHRVRRRIERSGRFWRGTLDLGVTTRRGRLIGEVQARKHPAQSLPSGVVEIGIVLFEPADRGKGYGGEAASLLIDWLFAEEGAVRVQAGTAAANTPARTILERLGFTFEGALRGFRETERGREDMAMYGILRDEWRR
jgi:RimJ/RimL family protein N-acetyltransferase